MYLLSYDRRTDLNQYDAGEFPTQNSELLGDYMQHPWLLDNSQVSHYLVGRIVLVAKVLFLIGLVL